MKISIVIPCYNANEHVISCLENVKAQTCGSWEAICVDDGSTDNTAELIKSYASEDRRIRYFYQINQGAAKARELGVSKAEGDYITFLDVDDTFTIDALQLMGDAFDDDTDMVVTSFQIVEKGKVVRKKQIDERTMSGLNYLKNVLCGKYGWELCAKMYRRKLFDCDIAIPVRIRSGEDAAVFVQLACQAHKVKLISQVVYNYIQYETSASHVKSLQYAEETLQSALFIENIFKQKAFYEEIRNDIDAMFLLFYSNSTRKAYLNHTHPLVKRIYSEHFSFRAFRKIPFYKAVYVWVCYMVLSHCPCSFCLGGSR